MAPSQQLNGPYLLVGTHSFDVQIITVAVGASSTRKDFVLPIDCIEHSEKLKAELNSICSNDSTETRILSLPDIMAEDFEVFVLFTYTSRIYSIDADENNACEWDRLARLWKLGSELESTSFKDAIVDATVCKATSTGKYPDRLPELFGGYLQHISGMRRLLVDISVAHRLDPTFRRSSSNPQCQLFYYDCSNAVDNLRGVEDSVCKAQQRLHLEEIFGTCWYHEHTHTAACYKVVCPAKSGHLRCKQSEIQEVGTTIAAISVASGATQKLFFVHTELISRNSDYLAAALSPRWNHSVETIEMIGLPGETRPSVFRAFLRFLATGRIELDSEDLKAPAHDQDSAGMLKLDLSLMFLGHLWILGDQIGSTSLRDAVTDKLMASLRIEGRLPLQLYPLVYRCSERPSGVRQLLVDAAVHLWNEGTITHAPREGAEDFFVELAAALMKRCKAGPLIAPFDRSEVGCRYHDHGDAEPCYKTAFASPDSSTKQSTDLSLLWPW